MFKSITLSSKEMRAKRIIRLRKSTGKSRQTFSLEHQLSAGTLQNWEAARYGGLSEKGAKLLINAFKANDIHCSFEWLMYGIGNEPLLANSTHDVAPPPSSSTTNRIDEELAFFHQHHMDAVHLSVQDQSMLPYFHPKQIVAGVKQFGRSIKQACIGQICIVQLATCQSQLLRLVLIDELQPQQFRLLHFNNLASSQTQPHTSYELNFAAPITWIREEPL